MKSIHWAAVLAASLGGAPAVAQTIDGSNAAAILELARGYGEASLESQPDGTPRISGHVGGVPYHVFLRNCLDGVCQDLNFYAGFAEVKPTLDAMNAWNRDTRFARAYLDAELDAVIEYDVNLEYGVTQGNLGAAFGVWSLALVEFAAYVGYAAE